MRRRVAEVMVILGLCVMAVNAIAVAQDPGPPPAEPVATTEPTPEPTPEATAEPTPEPTAEPTPAATPEPTPEPAAAQAAPAARQAAPEIMAAPQQAEPEPEPATVTLCHATGAASAPYVAITLPEGQLLGHDAHPADLIPAPAGGCPATAQAPAPTPVPTIQPKPEPRDEVTICHATGSRSRPFVELTVSRKGADDHRRHAADIVPAPEGGCPAADPYAEHVPAAKPKPVQAEQPRSQVLDDSRSGTAPKAPAAPVSAPAPSAAAAPVTRTTGTQLAYTGAEAWLMGVLGFGMAMAGAGLFLVTAEPPRPR